MFIPNYRLTPKLLFNISQIERFYGRLESLRIPQKLELNLERNNLIQSTYISNSIEGNPLTLMEVTNILLGGRVPVNREEKEVKNYFDILKDLDDLSSQKINLGMICSLHKKLLTGVNNKIAGEIRDKKVVVESYIRGKKTQLIHVKHNPPYHRKEQIESEIKKLFDWVIKDRQIPTVIKVGIFHHHFVFIHPFEDGNGRVCRLLSALILLQNDYAINKYFVLDDYYDIDRSLYSDKLHSADRGDKTEWLEYFSDGMKYSLQNAFGKYKNALSSLQITERLTSKEQEVLSILQEREEITSNDLADILKVSRQQAHNLLSSLLDKGFIGKKGSTKASYYFIK